jgi:hypothetical protein
MRIIIRDYRPEDASAVVDVFRDSQDTLRESRGGRHPDEAVDRLLDNSDSRLIDMITYRTILLVAQVEETGELAGIGGFTNSWKDNILGSTYSKSLYVKERFQRGKAGVNVGSLITKERLRRAGEMGFRKAYGYCTPESLGFHKKFGAKYYPFHNSTYLDVVKVHYYEIWLRPHILNYLRIEPFLHELGKLFHCRGLGNREGIERRLGRTIRSISPPLASFLYRLRTSLAKEYHLNLGRFSSRETSVLFLGPSSLARFYDAFFLDSIQKKRHGNILPFQKIIQECDADIVISHQDASVRPSDRALVMPLFVRSLIEIDQPFSKYIKSLGRSAKSDINKIKKERYSHHISTDPMDLRIFYDSMYLPMIENRHSNHSIVLGFDEMKSFFKKGFLLFVMRRGEAEGAMLLVDQGESLLMKSMGIRAGAPSLTLEGVNSALFYFSIKHAFENSYHLLDMGYSAPFSTDGVVLFKEKWGARHVADRHADKLLSVTFRDEHLKERFCTIRQPFLLAELEQWG